MTPTHSKQQGKLYRYYVTHTAQKRGHGSCRVRQVRAGDIEGIVFDQIKTVFRDPAIVVKTLTAARTAEDEEGSADSVRLTEADIREGLQSIDAMWDHLYQARQALPPVPL